MPKTTLTLSVPVAKALKVYTVQTKSSMHAQSQVVEEALRDAKEIFDPGAQILGFSLEIE